MKRIHIFLLTVVAVEFFAFCLFMIARVNHLI